MPATIRVPIEDSSQIAECRRMARERASELAFDETRAEEVAIVVTEAGTNILKHAVRGEILINSVAMENGQANPSLEILALDRGPGFDNLERCLRDGYSTGSSPGQGLGAIFRLSSYADIYSRPGKGTVMVARWTCPRVARPSDLPPLAIGAVNVCKTGEVVCGDCWGAVQANGHATLLLADGLGHGYEANVASQEAVRILRERPDIEPQAMLEFAHLALRSSRGAAVAVARINRPLGKLTFAGIGNISAQIYSGSHPQQHLVSVNGTAGHQVRQIREFSYPWPDNGVLILHSDGLQSSTGLEADPGLALRDPSLIAGLLYRDYSRGHDDATVVVVKDPGEAQL
jgi:anti-sigma regulatory factor (Ser/Thr protein kinase)